MIAGILVVLAATAAAARRLQRRWYFLEDAPHVSRKTLDKLNRLYPHGD